MTKKYVIFTVDIVGQADGNKNGGNKKK